MLTCPSCGATAPPASTWCGQCYSVLAAPAPASAPATVVVPMSPEPVPSRQFAPPPWVQNNSMVPAAAVSAPPPSPWAGLVPSPMEPGGGSGSPVSPPLPHRAVVLTAVAIAIGALAMGVSYLLGQDQNIAPATYLRYAIVLTLAVYAVVGILVVTQITPTVRLRWSDGQPVIGIAVGLLVGGGLSLVLLLLVSAATGHLDPDPRIVLLMSEGDASHVIAAVLISCVAAPLVEEVLFRGLLLESQRARGTAAAIWLSAAGFAVWHLNPAALRYYALLGALLGWLYTRRGLACSMAAHFAFNGVLTVAALSVVLSPGASLDVDGLTAQLPPGWRAASATDLPDSLTAAGSFAGFRGPSGAEMLVVAAPTASTPTVDEIYDRFSTSGLTTLIPGHTDLHELRLPAGLAVEVVAKIHGDDVTLVFLPHAGRSYELVMRGAGSVKARADFTRILRDLRVS